MLNPTFSPAAKRRIRQTYVAPEDIAQSTVAGNEAFKTGNEYRLQKIYGDEIWGKLTRAGLGRAFFDGARVLEVCAGTGYLTYHLLARSVPAQLIVNDISETELAACRALIGSHFAQAAVSWAQGDMHTMAFEGSFDVIIGNSFLHHFHNVPAVLRRFAALLRPGGTFISLHEPTPMSTVVEGGKTLAWPLACIMPGFVNDIARARYRGEPSLTDIWMFEAPKLRRVAVAAGFREARTTPWHLARAMTVFRHGLHLSRVKPELTPVEASLLAKAIALDSQLNRVLSTRCFGSVCLVCTR